MPNAQIAFLSSVAENYTTGLGAGYTLSDKIDRVYKPTVTAVYTATVALTAGAKTLNLGALVNLNGDVLNLTGKAVNSFCIYVPGANPMTFMEGAANGYSIFTVDGMVVKAGGVEMGYAPAGYGTVGATDITIDVTGTTTNTFQIVLTAITPA